MKGEDIDTRELEVDLFRLDEECRRQSVLYKHWADRLAEARFDYDMAKLEVEKVEGELDYEIRHKPSIYGLDKITEPIVASTIKRDLKYQQAMQAMHMAKRKVARLEATVYGLDHKKTMIVKAADLWLASYFSEPRPEGKSREYVEAADRRAAFGSGKPIVR